MNCLITSFQRSQGVPAPVFSAAVYQPKGYDYPKADWCDIRDEHGWIRPRRFLAEDEPLLQYHQALLNLYGRRRPEIEAWLKRVGYEYHQFALACWCPYDRAAQRQLQEHGSFVCHTAVIGEALELWHGVRVWYDTDRQKMKVLP